MLSIRSIVHKKFGGECMAVSAVGDEGHSGGLRNHEDAIKQRIRRRCRGEPNPHIGGLETRRAMRVIHGSAACLRRRRPTQWTTDSLRQDTYPNSDGRVQLHFHSNSWSKETPWLTSSDRSIHSSNPAP